MSPRPPSAPLALHPRRAEGAAGAPATPPRPRPPERPHRGAIALEDAEVLRHERHPAGQHVLRLHAPAVAARAAPGSFVHLRCEPGPGPDFALRRPMSVMRADPAGGWFELLFKEVGAGTARLARREPGERLSVLGPIGRGFEPSPARPHRLLVGGGVGIPPVLFLAERGDGDAHPVVLMGSEAPFPFELRQPSSLQAPGLPAGAGLACLEERGIPSRTASRAGLPGCFDGFVTDLARAWLEAARAGTGDGPDAGPGLGAVELFACGPAPMLRAAAALAAEFGVPSQLALEEYMACATGGCAGCTVRVRTPGGGAAMRRVCVDGPVFDGASLLFDEDGNGEAGR